VSRSGTIRIGISGWNYGGWRRTFYPRGLRHADELSYASRQVDTIEINGTHYSLQRPDSFARWHDDTPDGFVFAVKGSRFITHFKQLHDIETPLANFFASGVLRLEEKLGPFLWQFSPRFGFDPVRLDHFLSLLPRDSESAMALAARHDTRLAARVWTRTAARRELRHAVEIRPKLSRPRLRRAATATGWHWFSPTRPRGPTARTSPPISSICGCTAPRSSMPPAIPTRRSIIGRRGSSCGCGACNPMTPA